MPPEKSVSQEQKNRFAELVGEIGPQQAVNLLFGETGPKQAMHLFSGWLNESVIQGNTYPQYRDSASSVVSSLRDAETRIQNIRD